MATTGRQTQRQETRLGALTSDTSVSRLVVWFVEGSILYIDAKLWIRVVANLQHERAAKHWKRPGLLKSWAAQANTRHFTSCQWLDLFSFSMKSDWGHHLQLLRCFINVSSHWVCAIVTFGPLCELFKSAAKGKVSLHPFVLDFAKQPSTVAGGPANQRHRGQVEALSGGWGEATLPSCLSPHVRHFCIPDSKTMTSIKSL